MKNSIIAYSASAMLLATLAFGAFGEEASVNCDTAKEDLATLEAEKKSTLVQIEKGVASISPGGIVLGTVAGTRDENKEIATGDYNERIDAHIALIKSTCGIE